MRIVSPMPRGNGAYIVHQLLQREINGYQVCGYNPYWTLMPPAMYGLCHDSVRSASLIHTVPDYGLFFHREGVPQILSFHNYMLDDYMQKYSSLFQRVHYKTDLRWLSRASLKRATIVTSVSRFTADLVRDDLGFSGDIRVINNGVDTSLFVPGDKPAAGNRPLRILFAGNLTQRKGADLLPDIARSIGDGIHILYTSGLRTSKKLAELPELQRLGPVSYKDMPALYRSVDLLLLPTVREGFPLVVAEAMACGLPIIATDCSSLPELVDEGKGGYLCRQGDIEAFAQRINILAESVQLRREMGEYNRAKVEKHLRLETMVEQYRNLFDEVLDGMK